MLDYAAAGSLKELLTNEPALPLPIDASAREVLTEVGNILLNACLGTFGNLLKVQVSFSVPHLNLDTLHHVLQSLLVNREGLRYALVVQAGFKLQGRRGHRLPRHRAERGVARSADPRRRGMGSTARDRRDRAASSEQPDHPDRGDAAVVRRARRARGSSRPTTALVIRSWNRWLEQHTGLARAEVIGRPLLRGVPGPRHARLRVALPRRADRRSAAPGAPLPPLSDRRPRRRGDAERAHRAARGRRRHRRHRSPSSRT